MSTIERGHKIKTFYFKIQQYNMMKAKFLLTTVAAAFLGGFLSVVAGNCGDETSALQKCYNTHGVITHETCMTCPYDVLIGLETKGLFTGCDNIQEEFCNALNGCGDKLDCTAGDHCQSEWEAYIACTPPNITKGAPCQATQPCEYNPDASSAGTSSVFLTALVGVGCLFLI